MTFKVTTDYKSLGYFMTIKKNKMSNLLRKNFVQFLLYYFLYNE